MDFIKLIVASYGTWTYSLVEMDGVFSCDHIGDSGAGGCGLLGGFRGGFGG